MDVLVAGAAGFAGAGRAACRGGGQTAAASADSETRKEFLDIPRLTGRADDRLGVRRPDQSLEPASATLADKFVDRHGINILADFWSSVHQEP